MRLRWFPPPGYQIKITRKGFVDWESGQFTLALGQTMNFTVTLKHTAGYQGDESNIPKPRIEETQNGQGTLVSQNLVESLPSSNLRLDPLVQADPLAGVDHRTGDTIIAGQVNNLFVQDGVATTNTFYPSKPDSRQPDIAGRGPGIPGPVGELFGGVRARQGRRDQRVTHHGTNEFHGSGYEYFANSSLAASRQVRAGTQPFRPSEPGGRHHRRAGDP